jgi:hypothetical protein
LEPEVQEKVIVWARGKSKIILDPLAFLHSLGDLNSEERAIPLMAALKTIAREARTAVVAIHHARKASQAAKEPDDPLDMVRGSSALSGAAGVVLSVRETMGRIKLEVGKSQAAESPVSEIWLNWTDPEVRSGPIVLAKKPSTSTEVKASKLDSVLAVLGGCPSGMTKTELLEAMEIVGHKIPERTLQRYLEELVATQRVGCDGHGRSMRYAVCAPH